MLVVAGAVMALGLSAPSAALAAGAPAAPQAACEFGQHGLVYWYPTGDKAVAQDRCADGYAVRISIYQLNRDQGGTYWQYTGITAHAPSNGKDDTDGKDLLEGVRIRAHGYLINRNGTACHRNWYRTPRGAYLTSANSQVGSQFIIDC